MQKKNTFGFAILLLLIILNIGCDQVSKIIVRQKIDYNENISLIDNHLTLTKVENTGAFLSTGDNLPKAVRFMLLSILPIIVLGYGLYYLFFLKNVPKEIQLGLCFLIGGGIGNIFDRLMYGSVTDFLHIDFVVFRTGIFNFADISVMIGVGMLFFQSFIKRIDV
jgi:signal peptidase II